MASYEITWTEWSSYSAFVEADSEQEAIDMALDSGGSCKGGGLLEDSPIIVTPIGEE
jgi:hypothetical protein